MKIGILGSGDVGKALAHGLRSEGHDVVVGTRTPREEFTSYEEAAKFGEAIVLATLWSGTKNALDLAGATNLSGKVVIDATNPLVFAENAPPALALGHTDSGGEQVQRWIADARVVKAFNTVGNAFMYKPDFPGGPPTMFIAGDDDAAKKTVTHILTSFGWETEDAGGIQAARELEPLCILWVMHGIRTGSWNHAFKLLKK